MSKKCSLSLLAQQRYIFSTVRDGLFVFKMILGTCQLCRRWQAQALQNPGNPELGRLDYILGYPVVHIYDVKYIGTLSYNEGFSASAHSVLVCGHLNSSAHTYM